MHWKDVEESCHGLEGLRKTAENLSKDGFYRVLTMVYNTQNYWVFGLCPSSGF
jgi:hypothetical protein